MPETLAPPLSPTVTPAPDIPAPAPPTKSSLDDFDSHFNDLEEPTPKVPVEPSEPTPEPPKSSRPKDPSTGKFVPKSEPPKPEPKAEAPKPESKPAAPIDEYTPPQVATGGQLRSFAVAAGQKARQFSNELAQVKAELTKLRSTPQQDASALASELANYKKQVQDYEREMQVTRYESSQEYKERYEKPYQVALQQANSDIRELLVSEPDPNNPEATRDRPATAQDFDEVYNLALGPATRLAKQKFGDQAMIVLQHRQAIKSAAKAALGAIDEHKGKATEYQQQQTAQNRMIEEGRSRMFSMAIESIQTKYPEWFGEKEGDSEWNEAWSKGLAMADLAFNDRQGLTPQQSAILDAQIHMRSAAFGPMKMELSKLRAEKKQRDEAEAAVRDSAPGKTTAVGQKPPAPAKNWEEDFDAKVPE